METMNIKGKEYVTVNTRLKEFRTNPKYEGMSLVTELVNMKDNSVLMKAIVIDKAGKVIANGHAYEFIEKNKVNMTSMIENCETSAWGRALGNLGIGIDTSVASYDEMVRAEEKAKMVAQAPAYSHNQVMDDLRNRPVAPSYGEEPEEPRKAPKLPYTYTPPEERNGGVPHINTKGKKKFGLLAELGVKDTIGWKAMFSKIRERLGSDAEIEKLTDIEFDVAYDLIKREVAKFRGEPVDEYKEPDPVPADYSEPFGTGFSYSDVSFQASKDDVPMEQLSDEELKDRLGI